MKYLLRILLLSLVTLTSSQAGQNLLYAATGFAGSKGELYVLNPADGSVVTDVGPLNDSYGRNYGITGLRYDPTSGKLFGITAGASLTAPNCLVTIDPTTALVTYIGGPLSSRLSDIAIDPTSSVLYAVSGSSKYFYTVNQFSGITTRKGNTNLPPQRGGGLAANSMGVLYGTNDKTFYTYNKITGAATAIGGTNLARYVDALAFSSTDVLYGIEGEGQTDSSTTNRQRWLVVIDAATGAAVELGETVANLNSLAFVPVP